MEQTVTEAKPKARRVVGKRKSAIAHVRLRSHVSPEFVVNGKTLQQYFSNTVLEQLAMRPLELTSWVGSTAVEAKVQGGGLRGQAEALRHAISRAIIAIDPDTRALLKKAGFLTRDPRVKERKKYGLKRARRGPQFSKR